MKTKIALAALLLLSFVVFAAPGIPHQFYGSVSFSNGASPDNILIEAKIDGTVAATTTTLNGKYGYNPNIFFVTDPDGNRAGKMVEFYVQGSKVATATFSNGGYANLNLSASSSIGRIDINSNETITNRSVIVTPESPTQINVGSELAITVSSTVNRTANIGNVEKLTGPFFTGAYAVPSGKSSLNAYEIKITGNVSVTVTMTYSDAGIDESTVVPYKFDGTSWTPLPSDRIVSRDTVNNRITFIIIAETPYAIFGSPPATTTTTTTGGGAIGGCIANYTLTSPVSVEVTAGSNVTIPVTFTSTGTCSGSATIAATVPVGWSATSATTGSVPPSLSKIVYIIIRVPSSATSDAVVFTATGTEIRLSSITSINLPAPPASPAQTTTPTENVTGTPSNATTPAGGLAVAVTGFVSGIGKDPVVTIVVLVVVIIIVYLIWRIWQKRRFKKKFENQVVETKSKKKK